MSFSHGLNREYRQLLTQKYLQIKNVWVNRDQKFAKLLRKPDLMQECE